MSGGPNPPPEPPPKNYDDVLDMLHRIKQREHQNIEDVRAIEKYIREEQKKEG